MNDKLTMDVGLAVDLKAGFARNGWTERKIKKLSQGDILRQVLSVLEGRAQIVPCTDVVDTDAAPFAMDGCKVEEHQGIGSLDLAKSVIGLSEDVKYTRGRTGTAVQILLRDTKVLNGNVLDYLLQHPRLIPDEWMDKAVFFWGTVYRRNDDRLFVRYLHWHYGSSQWACRALDETWDDNSEVVTLVSR